MSYFIHSLISGETGYRLEIIIGVIICILIILSIIILTLIKAIKGK